MMKGIHHKIMNMSWSLTWTLFQLKSHFIHKFENFRWIIQREILEYAPDSLIHIWNRLINDFRIGINQLNLIFTFINSNSQPSRANFSKMKTIFVLLALIVLAYASADPAKQLADDIYNQLMQAKTTNTCAEQFTKIRKVFNFLPKEIRDRIIDELTAAILRSFPSLNPGEVRKVVSDLLDPNVPVETACRNFERLLEEEMRRRQQCIEKCKKEIEHNFTYERLIALVLKCKTDVRCYLEEVKEVMFQFQRCLANCIMVEEKQALSIYMDMLKEKLNF